MVDVLKTENAANLLLGWSTGTIQQISAENTVHVSLTGIDEEVITLPLGSCNIAPYGYYTGGNEWREELREGSLIDCMDTISVWYQSTVLGIEFEEINGKMVRRALVGFRRYESDGPKTDDDGRHYNGWSDKYDEWINPYSLRIQKPGTIAKMGKFACKKTLDEDGKESVEDTSDVLLNSAEEKEVYAVVRQEKAKSAAIVDMINAFGENCGFDNMLKRLEDTETFISYGRLSE